MIDLYQVQTFFLSLENFLGNKAVILALSSFSFVIKLFIIIKLLSGALKHKKTHASLILLIVYICTSMISDSAWACKFIRELIFPNMDYRVTLLWIRLAWVFNVIQFHSLSLFIESLIKKKKLIDIRQKFCIPITLIIACTFLVIAFTHFNTVVTPDKHLLLKVVFNIQLFYNLYALLLVSMIITLWNLITANLPKILKKQLKIFLWFIVAPNMITELINSWPFNIFHNNLHNQFALTGITLILTTVTICYAMKKVICLKFLDMKKKEPIHRPFDFIQDFKQILEQFSQVTSTKELGHITQNFFKSAFCIPIQKTQLYIRKINANSDVENTSISLSNYNAKESSTEAFINRNKQDCCVGKLLRSSKIFVTDGIEFSNYYEEDNSTKKIIQFLQTIDTAIFIPISEKNNIIAYIIVENHVRMIPSGKTSEFYSDQEKDQMVVFSQYLGNMIHLLHNRNLKTLIQKEKELEEELYSKHQEINQYKESVRSLIHKNGDKKIGIVFYRNRQFVFGNQIAKQLIPVNINSHEGHPVTQKMKLLAYQVLQYKAPHTSLVKDPYGDKLVLYAIPNIEKDEVIIAIHYPEISDLLKSHINLLKDPTKWDYLLYLETTESGKLINKLIPGNGQTLLNFKIDLLKIALSKKAILLDMPPDDLIQIVQLLHNISLRDKLHVINLQKPVTNLDLAITLFGINPIFQPHANHTPLLEILHTNGTLFIKNIHLMDLDTQNQLAEFIKYGIYKPVKGEQTLSSRVRILCSTSVNLKMAIQDGTFSKQLYNELIKTSLTMPPLMTLPETELTNLTKEFTNQNTKTNESTHLFELTDIEKKNIVSSKPASLQEMKHKIQKLLEKKSKQHEIYEETSFYGYPSVKDPEVIEAARLGKQALKNKEVMAMLWQKFQNQNKIATLLGVNRSSVNRRLKEHNLK